MNFSINIIDNINNNSGDVTFTPKATYRLETLTKNGGFRNEQKIYNIKGSTRSKTRITIATVKIAYNSSKASLFKRYFTKTPALKTNSNIRLVLKNVETYNVDSGNTVYRSGNYNHTYTFDVTYLSTKSVSKQDGVVASLIYKDVNLPRYTYQGSSVSGKIDKIVYGKSVLKNSGESREITIVGYQGARIILKVKDENGSVILDKDLKDIYPLTDSNGVESNCLDITIPKSGRYSFNQNFPGITIKGTAVNGSEAASGATKVIFDDLTDIKVGDQLVLASSVRNTVTPVNVTELDPDGDNANECTLSSTFTAADNTRVIFKRSKTYSIDWYYQADPNAVITSHKLYQYKNPVLTLKGKGNSKYIITQFNGVATSLGHSTDHEKGYSGIAGARSSQTKRYSHVKQSFDFSYLLTAAGGGSSGYERFATFTLPIFNKIMDSKIAGNHGKTSDWTNSVPSKNGGTDIDIISISATDVGAETITLSGKVIINKWGMEDVTMELDFDKLSTYS